MDVINGSELNLSNEPYIEKLMQTIDNTPLGKILQLQSASVEPQLHIVGSNGRNLVVTTEKVFITTQMSYTHAINHNKFSKEVEEWTKIMEEYAFKCNRNPLKYLKKINVDQLIKEAKYNISALRSSNFKFVAIVSLGILALISLISFGMGQILLGTITALLTVGYIIALIFALYGVLTITILVGGVLVQKTIGNLILYILKLKGVEK